MKREVFVETRLEQMFREKGYVIVPFLTDSELNEISSEFFRSKPAIDKGFHATSTNNDLNYRRSIHQLISRIYTPLAQKFIKSYEPVYASFVVKEPGQEGNFPLHMDWSMVDEREFVSLAFWTPLVDTNPLNGALEVLEGSHLLGHSYRGGPTLFQAFDHLKHPNPKLKLRKLYLKAGETVIYDHRLFHGSSPNLTKETRPALNFTMRPAESTLIHYHQERNIIRKYLIDNEFFLNYIMGNEPDGYPFNTIDARKLNFLNDNKIAQLQS